MIAAAADVALVLDASGVVRDVAYSAPELPPEGIEDWVGALWLDLVTIESRSKVEALLRDAVAEGPTRPREVNHIVANGRDMPIRYSTIRMDDDGRILALGRDLRSVATLQQRLVETQLLLEREYSKIRNAETRYRLLFQLSTEAVLIVDEASERVVEANAAASKLIGETAQRTIGRGLADLFDERSAQNVRRVIATARTLGHSGLARVHLTGGGHSDLMMSVSAFRQDSRAHFLVRLVPSTGALAEGGHQPSKALDAVMAMPDGFVVVDERQRVLDANPAFLALIEVVTVDGLRGAPLDKWLGRPGVEATLLVSNLREHGSLRNFSTILRGEFGGLEQVEVSGVAVNSGGETCFGLVIRPVRNAGALRDREPSDGFRSVEQLTQLVGRVSLKDLVRESTDLVEKLCIEAALKRTEDNRASAAQILGLSRQSLYSKLRRHGLLDDDSEPFGGD
ncbi:transcriptional regulator PpsR [Methylopila turkensis]|uniref:transcriptional regulator PpsR n=1 Tax=Methylopila turkensis TaxID=1437816 RepID=UPI003D1775A5